MSYYTSPRWSAEIADCSMPMTFDTYSNCSFDCIYCFSQYQRAVGLAKEAYLHKEVKHVNVERVKSIFTESLKGNDVSQFSEYIRQRKVMQWGGLSDQFDGYERVHGKTLELLRFFKEINYPICFSTKSVWWTKDKRYLELFRGQKNWNVKFSIITLDEDKAKIVEQNVPTPNERLEAIKRIADCEAGGVTLRLRPFIIGVSTPTYLELIRNAKQQGASALSTEFFCVEMRSETLRKHKETFRQLCGFDLLDFYRKYSVSCGYLRLNRNVKRPFVTKMKELCDEIGLRFYVSDAHFKELCSNGSCCGLPEDWNYSRGQWCEALMIAKRNGYVRFSDISNDILSLHTYYWDKAIGFNTNSSERRAKFFGMSMADYMRYLWNNPQCGQSPYKMYEGVLVPDGKDTNEDIIYKYNADVSIG